jgi:predicted nucleotidyltransferase
MSIVDVSEKLPDILTDFPEVSLVYLFGSQVTGQVGPMSDYDLALLHDSPENDIAIQSRFQHAFAQTLNADRIDVVLLSHVPVELAYHIIAKGKLLYKRDTLSWVEFEAGVLSRYGDYLPILRSQQEQILQGDVNVYRIQRYREALGRTQRTLGTTRTPSR